MENQLLKKLHIKPDFQVKVLNAPQNFDEIIGNVPSDVVISSQHATGYQALLLFAITKEDMTNMLDQEYLKIDQHTICWIFYPKARTQLASDLNLMQSWDELKRYNLAPCASAAIDSIWTALRIKPVDAQTKSGVGNAEILKNEYGSYIDVSNKSVKLPDDLKMALEKQPLALNFYQQLSYSNRKEYVLWILTAKQEKTRVDRIQKTIEKLLTNKKNPTDK